VNPGENYIGKDQLGPEALAMINEGAPASDDDLAGKMQDAIRELSDDDQIQDRIRKLEAIKNEHEVQERAKAYRQVEGLAPPEDRNTCPHCGGTITPPTYEVG
jgi:DNA repair exonuclease SbcCD ATPase subunit